MRQFEAFLAAAEAEERARLAELLTVVSVGTHGGRDAIRRLHREFCRAD